MSEIITQIVNSTCLAAPVTSDLWKSLQIDHYLETYPGAQNITLSVSYVRSHPSIMERCRDGDFSDELENERHEAQKRANISTRDGSFSVISNMQGKCTPPTFSAGLEDAV